MAKCVNRSSFVARVTIDDSCFVFDGVQICPQNGRPSPVMKTYVHRTAKKPTSVKMTTESLCPKTIFVCHYTRIGRPSSSCHATLRLIKRSLWSNAQIHNTGQCTTDSAQDWSGTCTAAADTAAERTGAAVLPGLLAASAAVPSPEPENSDQSGLSLSQDTAAGRPSPHQSVTITTTTFSVSIHC